MIIQCNAREFKKALAAATDAASLTHPRLMGVWVALIHNGYKDGDQHLVLYGCDNTVLLEMRIAMQCSNPDEHTTNDRHWYIPLEEAHRLLKFLKADDKLVTLYVGNQATMKVSADLKRAILISYQLLPVLPIHRFWQERDETFAAFINPEVLRKHLKYAPPVVQYTTTKNATRITGKNFRLVVAHMTVKGERGDEFRPYSLVPGINAQAEEEQSQWA